MNQTDPDGIEAVARYLASGQDPAVIGAEREQLDRVRALLSSPELWANPCPELVDDIVLHIETAPPSAGLGRGRSRGSRLRRWPPPGRTVVLGGLAAAVLAVVALVVVGRLGSSTDEDRVREVALAGTELAPEARATATLRETGSGVAVTLRTDGLPPAPAGFYYQAWVVGPAGAVPIGTFHQRGDEADDSDEADEAVELWSGVDLADYPLLTVTIEAEDGDPASSGRRVLQASLE